jgi:DNA-binding transcriptional regulator YbjK
MPDACGGGVKSPVSSKRLSPRRQDILEATLRVIGQGGVHNVSYRAVAQEANVSLASTTYYFDSKSALVEEALELMIARSTEAVRHYTTTRSRISRAELIDRILAFADAQINDPAALLSAQFELMLEAGRTSQLQPLARRWSITYMHGFAEMMRKAGIPRSNAAAEIIMTFVEGTLIDYVATPRDDFLEEYLRPLLADLVTAWCSSNGRGKRSPGAQPTP